MCQLCTIAVIGGLGISRFLGVDDLITAIWIGALILSTSFWTLNWIDAKWQKLQINKYKVLIIVILFALILGPLVVTNTSTTNIKLFVGNGIGASVQYFGYGSKTVSFSFQYFNLASFAFT